MPIFAYLDPVTGSAIIQMLLGAMAVAGLGWQYLRKGTSGIIDRFRKIEVPTEPEPQEVPKSV